MTLDSGIGLPFLISKAVSWAESQSKDALIAGYALDPRLLAIAKSVGVANPGRIRILEVSTFPAPDDADLNIAAASIGFFGYGMVGLALGYAIIVRSDYRQDFSLLSHEFRHVYQFEQSGSIADFLVAYIQQVVEYGYKNAPFEIDARAHEKHASYLK